jgi:hypothetical protein
MKQFEIEKKHQLNKSDKDLIKHTKNHFISHGFKLINETTIDNTTTINFQRGSMLILRLLGGLLIPDSQLPIKINIQISNNIITIKLGSNFTGIGTSIGLENKFNTYLNNLNNSFIKTIDTNN